ncbi:MAG: grasp-with-spasm system SPASM domain peptide maturase [Bacteroidales bacterium]|nr:grasp-with-spasm system SPASM domain peptide maturase [Bacteroidales bacterium]
MNTYNQDDYFIFSSNCKITKGYNRSLIIDYLRKEVYYVPNEYYDLLQKIDRNIINDIELLINDNSKKDFREFILFLLENEIGFVTKNIQNFPKISDEVYESNVLIKDMVIEIDSTLFNSELKNRIYDEINVIKCNDIQIKYISNYSKKDIQDLIGGFNALDINYIELHINTNPTIDLEFFNSLLESYAKLSHIYIYGKDENKITPYFLNKDQYYPLHLGTVYYTKKDINDCEYCGVINKQNLSFDNILIHNELFKTNGCLNKKVAIDRKGMIKNCLYMEECYGNIKEQSILTVLEKSNFKRFWSIKKDDIEVCKECEYRYSCTDCRAFINDENNILSKPLKCKYNPYTNVWKDDN